MVDRTSIFAIVCKMFFILSSLKYTMLWIIINSTIFLFFILLKQKLTKPFMHFYILIQNKVSKQRIKALFFRNLEKMVFVLKIVIKLYRYKYRLILILILKNFSFSIFLYFFITCKSRSGTLLNSLFKMLFGIFAQADFILFLSSIIFFIDGFSWS